MVRGRYNTHKQMFPWVESKKLKNYFESIIISFTFLNYDRAELRLKTKDFVFFKFRVESSKDENMYFQLTHAKNDEIYNLSTLQVIKNEGKELVQTIDDQINRYDSKLAEIQCLAG